ncbi:unnamed protein product [Nyctereutes procyonoides]|uniref:(raccoon dog) hypothetical protein n=1 Tax=Nyctereutes procyonoides TaxID=34880 RepID=A0A811YCD3_NYCPR|nr:unnamed protein product [Nyctereutes procyonoides]
MSRDRFRSRGGGGGGGFRPRWPPRLPLPAARHGPQSDPGTHGARPGPGRPQAPDPATTSAPATAAAAAAASAAATAAAAASAAATAAAAAAGLVQACGSSGARPGAGSGQRAAGLRLGTARDSSDFGGPTPTPPPAPPSSGAPTTPPQAGGPPPPSAGGPGPAPKQGPGPGGPKGGKMPGGPKPGGGPGLSTPGGHPKPPHRGGGGGGEPRGGRQHHPPYHQQHRQGPPPPPPPPPGGPCGPCGRSEEKVSDSEGFKANLSLLRRPGEKTCTQRCRLFVGNLPADITEDEFKRPFAKYGEPGEVFINKGKGFGFIELESRALAEIAKAELDDTPMRGRQLRGRFATHAAALQFGPIERAVVIVDDRGRSTGKGTVEFASEPAARKAFERCSEGVFLLTTTPRPVVVEPLEQLDDEHGLPEKLAQKNPMYQKERETPPRFAQHGTFEYEYSQRWKSLDEMEKQQREQANLLRQDLMRRQEELRRMEELHNQEMQKRKEMQLRQEEERRRREEEMMIWQREMEEQMRHQREESYSRMGYMDPRERDMRMGGGGAMNMGDPYGSGGQKFPPLGGGGGIGYEANPGVPPATMSGSMMGSDMRTERFGQGGAGPVGGQGPRGMGPGTPAGYGRGREEYEGPNKKPRF